MRSRLPNHLNPQKFKKELGVYPDEHENRYSLSYKNDDFLIDNRTPFRIFLAAGISGEDLEERKQIIELLQIAERIHFDTGEWPALSTEWAEMCPGATIRLDVTPFAVIDDRWLRRPLPVVMQSLSTRLEDARRRIDGAFAKAEKQYRSELEGIAAFSERMRAMQREFDANPLCTINANTKARRLRYLVVISTLTRTPINSRALSSGVLKWAEEHAESLKVHDDPKGAILSTTGPSSVAPYIELARQIAILIPVGRKLTLTNIGRVLPLIEPCNNNFALSIGERLYFLFELLSHDRDLILPLILQLATSVDRKSELRRRFPTAYKEYLLCLRDLAGTVQSRRHIDDALQRANRWRNAEKYMEHVVDPRISWLVDINLCKLKADRISVTERGVRFANWVSQYADGERFVITKDFLRRNFFKTIAHIVDETHKCRNEPAPEETVLRLLGSYCQHVKQHTFSLAPNRIIASTLFRYAGIRLWVEHGLAADFSRLVEFFSDEKKASTIGWRLRWLAAQDDGYLAPLKNQQ